MKYKTVLFDFDGILMDTSKGIVHCVKKTLEHNGAEILPEPVLRKFIGPPLKHSFMEECGMRDEEALEAVRYYREQYADGYMFEANLYPGMEEILKQLNDAGVTCGVASVKMEKVVRKTLAHFELTDYFDAICGAPEDANIQGKEAIVREAVSRTNSDIKDCLLIGDSHYDAQGAEDVGIDFCAVLWGFGFEKIEDLTPFTCRYIAEDVSSLEHFLLK